MYLSIPDRELENQTVTNNSADLTQINRKGFDKNINATQKENKTISQVKNQNL